MRGTSSLQQADAPCVFAFYGYAQYTFVRSINTSKLVCLMKSSNQIRASASVLRTDSGLQSHYAHKTTLPLRYQSARRTAHSAVSGGIPRGYTICSKTQRYHVILYMTSSLRSDLGRTSAVRSCKRRKFKLKFEGAGAQAKLCEESDWLPS